jgi:UDP-N-acetyl-D-glucosamine dehydrogenase
MLQHTVSRPGSPGPAAATLRAAIQAKTARVGIIGQGYVGLPLAMAMCAEGFDVTGYDADAELAAFVKKGSFRGRSDFSDLGERDVISICVPTPLSKTRDPDISYIVSACEQVVKNLRPGQLIVLESTTYPGTTYELVLPMFEKAGMEVGRDFFLCFSPERVDPARWGASRAPAPTWAWRCTARS